MVELELSDGLAVVTIDRPQARNAIAPETMDQLEKALDAAEGARALVIRGAGDKAFVSGEISSSSARFVPSRPPSRWPGGCGASAIASRTFPLR